MTTPTSKYRLPAKVVQPVQTLQAFFQKFSNDWAMTFAAALAYSLLMAVLPIALALFSILGFILGESQTSNLMKSIVELLPGLSSQQQAIENQLNNLANQASLLALLAVLLAVFGGSRLFLAIENCLSIVYRVRPRTMLRQNIMAIFMMLIFIILVPIMFLAAILPGLLMDIVGNYPLLQQIPFFSWLVSNAVTTYLIGFLGGLLAAFLLFAAIYLFVPNQRIRLKNTLPGALVAALATVLFLTIIFPFYTTNFMGNYAGQAGFVVILLVFFYYFAVILIFGAEVNAFFFEKIQPIPNDLATFVTTMAGKLNQDIPTNEGSPHTNPKPTEDAHDANVSAIRIQEKEIQKQNHRRQPGIVDRIRGKNQQKTTQVTSRKGNLPMTLLQVALGSLLAMLVQLFQARKRDG